MNFKIRGRGSGTVEFLKSGDCFDAPSHIPYVQTIERPWIVVESEEYSHSQCLVTVSIWMEDTEECRLLFIYIYMFYLIPICSISRVNVGGKVLTNHLKEVISYRYLFLYFNGLIKMETLHDKSYCVACPL